MKENTIETKINKIIDSLTVEEMCGQVICMEVHASTPNEEVFRAIKENHIGALYVWQVTQENIKKFKDYSATITDIPLIIASDVESGPGDALDGKELLPQPMAWGACDDEELIKKAGIATGEICREYGLSWTFSPVVDININPNNPVVNIRAVADTPLQVVKIAGAYASGLAENGNMVACAKHFPGDGVDDRNQHFCTSVNNLSRKQWDLTFGKVYSQLIKQGISSIMVAHIALPCYDDMPVDELGYMPAVLSKSLITNLLKKKLNFNGCVVSDAMSMVGSASRVPLNKLSIRFINAGGDMVLFPEENDYNNILSAVQTGEITLERMKDAVRRVLRMKNDARLFEDERIVLSQMKKQYDIVKISNQIAEKSIKIERDIDKVLPIKVGKNAKFLLLNICKGNKKDNENPLQEVQNELERHGYETLSITNASHYDIHKIIKDYDVVLINSKISSKDYHGGSNRIDWVGIMTFWRAYVLNHPCVIFTSFGDPYKLYELPFLKCYINAFSYAPSSQRALVKVILGEINSEAKNPVQLENFFVREIN